MEPGFLFETVGGYEFLTFQGLFEEQVGRVVSPLTPTTSPPTPYHHDLCNRF